MECTYTARIENLFYYCTNLVCLMAVLALYAKNRWRGRRRGSRRTTATNMICFGANKLSQVPHLVKVDEFYPNAGFHLYHTSWNMIIVPITWKVKNIFHDTFHPFLFAIATNFNS